MPGVLCKNLRYRKLVSANSSNFSAPLTRNTSVARIQLVKTLLVSESNFLLFSG